MTSELDTTINVLEECSGSMIPTNILSDMQWDYSYPVLTLGTVADNYWCGHCAVYDRSTKFDINDLNELSEFRVTEVGFDDYLWIKINDNTAYIGPDTGDRLEVDADFVKTNDNNSLLCERANNWNLSVNIDLKPYLVEGENKIWTRTVVSGSGESWMKIVTTESCKKR